MSLVNDVLKDLESRGHRPVSASHVSSVAHPQAKSKRPWVWILLGVLVFAACVALYASLRQGEGAKFATWFKAQEPVAVTSQADSNRVNDTPAQAEPETEVSTEITTRITQMKIIGVAPSMQLEFYVNKPLEVIVSQQKTKEILLDFGDTYAQTTLPSYDPALFKNIEISRRDGRLFLQLSTELPAHFTLQSVSESRWQLGITLLNTPPPQVAPAGIRSAPPQEPMKVKGHTVELAKPQAAPAVAPARVSTSEPKPSSPKAAAPKTTPKVKPQPFTETVATSVKQPVIQPSVLAPLDDAQVVDNAKTLLKAGQETKAKELLVKAIAQSADNIKSTVLLASLNIKAGDRDEAQALISAGLNQQPDDVELQSLQARLWLDQGHAEKAMTLLSSSFPPIAMNEPFYELLAVSQQKTSDYVSAAKTYYSLLQQSPNNPRYWSGLGYALEKGQKYADARTAYGSALRVPSINASLKQFVSQRLSQLPE
ncbi:MAG: tetratricopeptide repeat protein [Pontibacterium sp.]